MTYTTQKDYPILGIILNLTPEVINTNYYLATRFAMIYTIIFTARRNARIASAVLATAIPSVRPSVSPSVCLSVTRRYCVKTTAHSTCLLYTSPSPRD